MNPTLQAAMVLHQTGKLPEAILEYQKIIASPTPPVEAFQYLSVAFVDSQRANEAIPVLENGLTQFPDHHQLLGQLTTVFLQTGNVKKALSHAQKLATLHPDDPNVQYTLANTLLSNQQPDEALIHYQKTVELESNFAHAWYNMGCLHYSAQRIQEAFDAFQQTIKVAPDLIQAYLNLGQIYNDSVQFQEAIQMYKKAVELDPNQFIAHQQLGMSYHGASQLPMAEQHYQKAYQLVPDNLEIQILLGNVYRDLNEDQRAIDFYKKVLAKAPDNATVQQNLRRLEGKKISAWHFAMLADTARNKAYDAAISKAVTPESVVLDIGTGSGLLAMMAARAGCKKVIACEMVDALAKVAQTIVKDNHYESQIQIVNKKSTALHIGEELPEKAAVLVSEILDCGLLGEGVLPTYRHALQELMQPNAKVIPAGAELIGQLVQTKHLHLVHPIQKIEGFDLSAFDNFRVPDEYTRIHLKTTPHQVLSEVFPVFSIDFSRPGPPTTHQAPNKFPFQVQAQEDGTADAFVFWFDLHLDEEIALSSGPDGEMIHWGQAIYFFDQPFAVKKREWIELVALQSDMHIRFRKVKQE